MAKASSWAWLVILWTGLNQVGAQVVPPNLLCLDGTDIIWEIPTNNCGAFQAYEIYFSTNEAGPYTLLTAITDPGQTVFNHPNPMFETYYYYMVSVFDCPGEPQIPSDTLNNLLPLAGPIEASSVTLNGEVVLNWEESPSSETVGYIIFRLVGQNVDPIDTVFNATTYTDLSADPEAMSELYYVLAFDACGNVSLFGDPHQTVFLQGTSAECDRGILLEWNRYTYWSAGLGQQELWVADASGTYQLATTLGPEDSTFLFTDIIDGEEYCFYLKSLEASGMNQARSNQVCVTADIVQPLDDFALTRININNDQTVQLNWVWDPMASIDFFSVERTLVSPGVTSEAGPFMADDPLAFANKYEETGLDMQSGRYQYRITATDACDSTFVSTTGYTIYIGGNARVGGANRLQWTHMELDSVKVLGYDLYRVLDGQSELIAENGPQLLGFKDDLDGNIRGIGQACYYVVGYGEITLPSGVKQNLTMQSNTVCLEQLVNIQAPNAFAPRGLNNEFKPLVTFAEAYRSYTLQIFDRYGGLVFTSDEVETGWNGKKNGTLMPAGVYIYRIELVQADGRISRKEGTVVLIQ